MDIDDYLEQLRNDLDRRFSNENENQRSDSSGQSSSETENNPEDTAADENIIFCPECGCKLPPDAKFCSECGCKIDDECENECSDYYGESCRDEPEDGFTGIIMTDIERLSEKYEQSTSNIVQLLQEYISQARDRGNFWHLLNIAEYRAEMQDNSWQEYNRIVDVFIENDGLAPGPELFLFIIGGDDVVPIPMQTNPQGGEDIPCDMSYSFSGDFLNDMISRKVMPKLVISKARCMVGRLPLEDGKVSEEPQALYDDLQSYFNLTGAYAEEGIPVGSVLMTSHRDWMPASATMSEHLPLEAVGKQSPYIKDGIFVSPDLMTSNEDSLDEYIPALEDADLLMFNLHGSDTPGFAGFYSEDEAFAPSLLQYSNARVLNTVACFGARYHGYNREDSMMLSALYGGGVMLYTGSLISVPMLQDNEARELLMNPGTGSEVFMRLYTLYQFKGLSAGRALLQAKCDYFNLCRHVEEDGFTLATAMMFSLYGNPMLKVSRKEEVLNSARQNDLAPIAPVKANDAPLNIKHFRRVMTKQSNSSRPSLLSEVRGLVDANLQEIRDIVAEHLYKQLGLQPRDLAAIDAYDSSSEKGYRFRYRRSDSRFGRDVWADTSPDGRIKRIYTTKHG